MKLYVWEEVMCDWTCGIAFALAGSLEEAKKLITDKYCEYLGYEIGEFKEPPFLQDNPKIYDTSVGYSVWGGG